jgi:hypothetical protein
LNTNLTSIAGLANAAGALTNNGFGVFSYVGTSSFGGFNCGDSTPATAATAVINCGASA